VSKLEQLRINQSLKFESFDVDFLGLDHHFKTQSFASLGTNCYR
jgi:hypothetical protein